MGISNNDAKEERKDSRMEKEVSKQVLMLHGYQRKHVLPGSRALLFLVLSGSRLCYSSRRPNPRLSWITDLALVLSTHF